MVKEGYVITLKKLEFYFQEKLLEKLINQSYIQRGIPKPFKRQQNKMVKHTQTNRRLTADELFECV